LVDTRLEISFVGVRDVACMDDEVEFLTFGGLNKFLE